MLGVLLDHGITDVAPVCTLERESRFASGDAALLEEFERVGHNAHPLQFELSGRSAAR